jgi:amino acid transporter
MEKQVESPEAAYNDNSMSKSSSDAVGESHNLNVEKDNLQRGFKPRHVNMFAIAGSIGTGLIIGSGSALAAGGPGSLLIAYIIMGACVYFVMTAFAEMAVYVPMRKSFSGYATRFVDPALG